MHVKASKHVSDGICVCLCLCVKERRISFGGPREDIKHFKGSLCDAEHDICRKTQGLSADLPLVSLWLTRQQSKMSFSLTLFWWICSTVCLLKSTTEDLANEPWALWIKQQGRKEVVREKPRSIWTFEEQRGTEDNMIGADSGSQQSPAWEKKFCLALLRRAFNVQSVRECFVRCINRELLCGFYLTAVASARASCFHVEFCSTLIAFNCLDPEHRLNH